MEQNHSNTAKCRWYSMIVAMLIMITMLLSTACGDNKEKVGEKPAERGEMREIALEDVPYSESFEAFVYQAAWPPSDYWYYDSSETPDDGVIGLIAMRLLYGDAMITPADSYRKGEEYPYDLTYYVEDAEDFGGSGDYREYEPDPRDWFPGGVMGGYCTFDQDQFESYLRNIWHLNDEAIETVRECWESDYVAYVSDGKYYHEPCGSEAIYAIDIKRIDTDGVDYLVTYETGTPKDHSDLSKGVDESGYTNEYIEKLRLETIDGKQYWTIYSNVKCANEGVTDDQDGLLDFGEFTILAPGYEYVNSESAEGAEALMYGKGDSGLCVKWEEGELTKYDYSNIENTAVEDAEYSGISGFEVMTPGIDYTFTFIIGDKSWQISCSDESEYYSIVNTIELK